MKERTDSRIYEGAVSSSRRRVLMMRLFGDDREQTVNPSNERKPLGVS
jgi:serine/threonine protein phosphatase PrpC